MSYCQQCGRAISESESFCGQCGTRNPFYSNITAGSNVIETTSAFSQTETQTPYAVRRDSVPKKPAQQTPDKQYFGKPALIFCLLLILALSVTCGIFIALYITAVG